MGDNEEQLNAMEKLTKRVAGMLPANSVSCSACVMAAG